eukprot:jgi/Psemu1/327873/estExt_fgenesh1_pg.C_8680004
MILSLATHTRTIVVPVAAVLALLAMPIVSSASTGAGTSHDLNFNSDSGCGGDERFGCGELIMLEDFAAPRHTWEEMNDPVMGGKSTGSFVVDTDQKLGVFHGSVEIVSFLRAPGFIKAETAAGESWPDVSACEGLQLIARSSTPDYRGFRLSFGHKRPPHSFPYIYGFKTDVHLVKLPFDSFTDKWDAGTGDAIVTCKENKEYCPDAASLKDLYSIAVWGEGVEGEVDLQIQSISAYGCKSATSAADAADGDGTDGVDSITIEDFSDPVHEWRTMNDPVMGGKSKSSVTVHDGMASFEGTCAVVPFLHAPGFITMTTGEHHPPSRFGLGFGALAKDPHPSSAFPDVSGCEALAIRVRSRDATVYDGYYVSFGTDRVPGGHHAFGYKTHFAVDAGNGSAFGDVVLPFSSFSSHWDEATGETTVTCAEDPSVCPTPETLRDMKTMSFWAEGVEGDIALDVERVSAIGCNSSGGGSPPVESGSAGTETATATTMVLGGWHSGESGMSCGIGMVALFGVAVALFAARVRSSRRSASLGYAELDQKADPLPSDLA